VIEQIQKELVALELERDEFIKEVNQEIVFRNGQISGLRQLMQKLLAPTENAGPSNSEAEEPSATPT